MISMDQAKMDKLIKKFTKEKKLNFLAENRVDIRELEMLAQVIKSNQLSCLDGNLVRTFENEFAQLLGVKHAIAVNSGTAALFVAMRAWGIKPGDEVIVPPFTFMASASSVLHNNAIPVFADIEVKTYNMDPEDAIKKITDKTKAIMPVHLAGMPADMGPLIDVCKEKNIMLLEDACQAHMAKFNGKYVGTVGDAGAFSFYPSKNMTTGEGGMITTDNEELAEVCRQLRHHGEEAWYKFARLGWNYRMDELGGAVGLAQVKKMPKFVQQRQMIWAYIRENIKGIPGVIMPDVPDYAETSANWLPIRIDAKAVGYENTQQYVNELNKKNAFTKIIYPEPLYHTKVFQEGDSFLAVKLPEYKMGLCPVCEQINKELIGVDTHPEITKEHCDFIINRFKVASKVITE